MTNFLKTARAVNEAGTPGPWIYDSYTTVHSGLGPVNYSDKKENDANLVRVAFFDPDTVSAMLDLIEAANGLHQTLTYWKNDKDHEAFHVGTVSEAYKDLSEAKERLERLTEGQGE